MSKMSGLKALAQTHRPELLIVAGALFLVSAGVTAVIRTFNFTREMDAYGEACTQENVEPDMKYVAKEAAKTYGPSVAMTAGGIALTALGIKDVWAASGLVLSAGAQVVDKASPYIQNAKETIVGQPSASQSTIADNQSGDAAQQGSQGRYLFFLPITGTYFYSSKEAIRQAASSLDDILVNDGDPRLIDFTTALGLADSDVAYEYGWEYEFGCRHIKTVFENYEGKTDVPCLQVVFNTPPKHIR